MKITEFNENKIDEETNTAENENLNLVTSVANQNENLVISFPSFPEELQEYILSHLPMRELVGFKCVAKQWKNFFENPQFAVQQFSNSPSPPMFFVQDTTRFPVMRHSLFSVKAGNPSTVKRVSPIPEAEGLLRLVGSAHGLICVAQLKHPQCFTVFNPATRIFLSIPQPPFPSQPNLIIKSSIGFGYDSVTNVFVLIRFFLYRGEHTMAQSYDFEDETWSYLNGGSEFCFRTIKHVCDAVIKGIPYWRVLNPKLKLYQLACYDHPTSAFTLESFKWEGHLPSIFGEFIEGFLCAVVHCNVEARIDLWCRESPGEWKLMYRVDYAQLPDEFPRQWGRIFALTWDETIVTTIANRVYVIKLDKLKDVECIVGGWSNLTKLVTCKESLMIPPKGYRSFGSAF